MMQVVLTACNSTSSSEKVSDIKREKETVLFEQFLRRIDQYMDNRAYDSAQMILNDYSEKLLFRQPDIYSFLQASRQSEIYYYNNLHQLGLQEAQKAEMIAAALKNNSLLLDAYNFEGLFYTNLGNMKMALQSFYSGAKYAGQGLSELSEKYNLSRPYHLYGNLAEAFYNTNQIDSSIYYCRISKRLAEEAKENRAISAANIQLGDAFLKLKQADSAIHYYESVITLLPSGKNADVRLLALGNLAAGTFLREESGTAYRYLSEGFSTMGDQANINPYYQEQFLLKAKSIYEAKGDYFRLSMAMDELAGLYEKVHDAASLRYLEVAMSGLKKESKILNMQVEKANQAKKLANTRLLIIVLILVIFVIVFLMYRFYSRQKLGLANLRNKISQDLHDEVGATLSGIALYSHVVKSQFSNGNEAQADISLKIIEKNATDMVKKLSDIIWAVNPKYDNIEHLLLRLYEFAVELAQVKSIQVVLDDLSQVKGVRLKMEQRKNIYLICKEVINNAVKYSECKIIKIKAVTEDNILKVSISDDGKGFGPKEIKKGNGLDNLQSRADEIGGLLEIHSSEMGTEVNITCKIT